MNRIENLMQEVFNELCSANVNTIGCLKKTKIIAEHYNDLKTLEFIENELKGYPNSVNLPGFRIVKAGIFHIEVITKFNIQTTRNRITKTIDFPFLKSINSVLNFLEKDEEQENIIMTFKTENMNKSVDLVIAPSEFKDILLGIETELLGYINSKLTFISKQPFDDRIMTIFNKFHLVAELLRIRKENKTRFEIKDENDVHFLLHPLLRLDFDSVKHEESLPDFAGKNPKIDFFIPDKTGIEVKKVRNSKHSKTIIDEISADKDLYRKDSRIKELFFFVYDPESYIRDRTSFVKDLEGNKPDEFEILKVIIKPDI